LMVMGLMVCYQGSPYGCRTTTATTMAKAKSLRKTMRVDYAESAESAATMALMTLQTQTGCCRGRCCRPRRKRLARKSLTLPAPTQLAGFGCAGNAANAKTRPLRAKWSGQACICGAARLDQSINERYGRTNK
jgi:hypothetical protein